MERTEITWGFWLLHVCACWPCIHCSCHICVVTGPAAHVHTVSPLALHWWNIFLEVTDSSTPSCCSLPWKYAFSRLTVKWRHSWGMGSGDVLLYCSVVNKKFCIPALSSYFCSSLKKIITSTELLQERCQMHRNCLASTLTYQVVDWTCSNFCLLGSQTCGFYCHFHAGSSPLSPVPHFHFGFFSPPFLTSWAVAVAKSFVVMRLK